MDVERNSEKNYGFYIYSPQRRIWEYVMIVASIFSLWEIVFIWVFYIKFTFYIVLISLIFDVLFFCDIFIRERTGFLRNGIVVLDKEELKANLSEGRRIISWIQVIPFYLIGYFLNHQLFFSILMTIKILRIIRYYEAYRIINDNLIYINHLSQTFLQFTIFLTVVHIFACLFILVGKIEHSKGLQNWLDNNNLINESFFSIYVDAFYFTCTTVLTVGYGDITPITFCETFYILIVEIIGVFNYNFLLSKIVSLIASPSNNLHIKQYRNALNALESMSFSDFGKEELLNYYQFEFDSQHRYDYFNSTVKETMPLSLQKRIMVAVNYSIFSRLQFLSSDEILEKIAMKLKPKIFMPGDYLVNSGKISKNIYFLTEGTVSLVNKQGDIIQEFTGDNKSVFGENSVTRHIPEVCSVVANTFVEAYKLHHKDLAVILDLGISIQNLPEF